MAIMHTEITPNFKGRLTEFNHQAAPAFDFEISKLLGNHWEIATDLNLTYLKGYTDNPEFTAEGVQPYLITAITDPVEYSNKLLGQKISAGYYLRAFERYGDNLRLEPFVRIGAGYQRYTTQLKYSDTGTLIYGINTGSFKDIKLTRNNFYFSGGVKTHISGHFFISLIYTFNYVNYDFLDAVHNYYSDGTFADLRGLYSDFKIGVFYHFYGKNKRKGKGRGTNNQQYYLPFSAGSL